MKRQQRQQKSIKLFQIEWQMPQHRTVLLLVLAGLLIVLLVANQLWIRSADSPSSKNLRADDRRELVETTHFVLTEIYQVSPENLTPRDSVLQVSVPRNFPFYDFYARLRRQLNEQNGAVLDCVNLGGGEFYMVIGKNKKVAERLRIVPSSQSVIPPGSASIIIDDFGFAFNAAVEEFLKSNLPISVSIIPGVPYSKQIADVAYLYRKPILVHMPMEPLNAEYDDNGYTLITGQNMGIVSLRVRKAFAELPEAIGLNNHQGSKATADRDMMRAVMTTLKSMNKFFIDSYTNPRSIAFDVAQSHGVPAAKNRMFLDAIETPRHIESQLRLMAQLARRDGHVIAIGHAKPVTLQVLKETIPELQAMGINFVSIEDVLE